MNKLHQLTIVTSVDPLLFLIDECHGHIRDHESTFLSGQLSGSLKTHSTQLSQLSSMSLQCDGKIMIAVWVSTLAAGKFTVARGPGCCTCSLNNTTRSLPCTERVLQLDSILGLDHTSVCSLTVEQIAAAIGSCSLLGFYQNIKPWYLVQMTFLLVGIRPAEWCPDLQLLMTSITTGL